MLLSIQGFERCANRYHRMGRSEPTVAGVTFPPERALFFANPEQKKSLGHKAKTRFFVQLFGEVSIDGECDNVRICGRDGIGMPFCAG